VYIHFLDLIIGHVEAKLSYSRLDGVPACQARRKVDIASQAKIGRVENLICAGVVEDGLGVDASLVGEGTEASNGVVEGGVNLYSLGYHVLNLQKVRKNSCGYCDATYLLEHVELILALDILRACNHHASQEAAKGCNAVTLTNYTDLVSFLFRARIHSGVTHCQGRWCRYE
jgi:hypothetical protein